TIVSQSTAPAAADGSTSASIAALPAGLYQIETSVVGSFYSSPTTTTRLVVVDPSLSVSGQGSIPTAMLPPNDTASFDLQAEYDNGGPPPTGALASVSAPPGN